jgi:hypothetical protein
MSVSALDLGCIFADGFDYLATDDPLFLTPAAGGDPVKFLHGRRQADFEAIEQDPTVAVEFVAWTMEPLCIGGVYAYNGESWTVGSDDHHKAGGPVAPTNPNTPFSYTLFRHTR